MHYFFIFRVYIRRNVSTQKLISDEEKNTETLQFRRIFRYNLDKILFRKTFLGEIIMIVF